MSATRVVIHAEPRIAWQASLVPSMVAGLRAIGVPWAVTRSRERTGIGLPILLGTTCFRAVEAGGPFLLVDRCSFGDPGKWLSIVLGGHGRRGDHRVPPVRDGSRWDRHGIAVHPWRTTGTRTILCGQTEPWSPHHATVEAWYDSVGPACTHFRPHPSSPGSPAPHSAAARLPETDSWDDCRCAVTLNSSVAVSTVLAGIPTATMDEGAMAWDVTSHDPGVIATPDRTEWLHWLAWTQWSYDEIREGVPWPRFL